jgi:hypothetical protein
MRDPLESHLHKGGFRKDEYLALETSVLAKELDPLDIGPTLRSIDNEISYWSNIFRELTKPPKKEQDFFER